MVGLFVDLFLLMFLAYLAGALLTLVGVRLFVRGKAPAMSEPEAEAGRQP